MSAAEPNAEPAANSAPRPKLADSPWFWAYVFGAAALVALFVANAKFGPRQAQIEREFQARTRAAQQLNGQEPSLELSTPQQTLITLGPLWIVLAVVTIAGWFLFWQSRRASSIAANSSSSSLSSPSSPSSPVGSSHVDSGQ
jgi:hypothetical protein